MEDKSKTVIQTPTYLMGTKFKSFASIMGLFLFFIFLVILFFLGIVAIIIAQKTMVVWQKNIILCLLGVAIFAVMSLMFLIDILTSIEGECKKQNLFLRKVEKHLYNLYLYECEKDINNDEKD